MKTFLQFVQVQYYRVFFADIAEKILNHTVKTCEHLQKKVYDINLVLKRIARVKILT